MKRLNYLYLIIIIAVCAALGWGVLQWQLVTGRNPILPTPLLGLLFIALAGFLFVQGRRVLKLKRRQYTTLTPTGAFRVAVMSHSSAYTASCFVGLLASQLVGGLLRWDIPLLRSHAIASIYGLAGAIILLIVSIVVEYWCVIDDDDEQREQHSASDPMKLPRRATSRNDVSVS